MITQQRLRELLHYDKITGVFTWIHRKSGITVGQVAGCRHNKHGYVDIKLDGRSYKAHRLAVLYVDGYFPELTVDHEDRVRHNNAYENLREASYQCQSRNCTKARNNTSSVTGVRWRAQRNRWQAFVMVSGEMKYLGHFSDLLDAACARYAAEQCLDYPDWSGDSTAKKYMLTRNIVCR